MSGGIHIWTFRFDVDDYIDIYSYEASIGVWKTESGEPLVENVLISNTNYLYNNSTGYAISTNGFKMVSPLEEAFDDEIKSGDVIRMILDLNKLILTFKVNGQIKTEFINIENTSYRAVVSTEDFGQSFTLISYQDCSHCNDLK